MIRARLLLLPGVLALVCTLIASPARAGDRVGSPYRGPEELTSAGSGAGTEGTEDTNNPDTGETGDTGDTGDEGATTPSQGGIDRGKVAKLDGNIVWQWWWEHNKDRYLARNTQRGRVAAGSAYYWFGSGAKFPPRQIDTVSPKLVATKIFPVLKQKLRDPDVGVRAEACIAMGRLGHVAAPEGERGDDKPDNLVVRELIRVLEDSSNPANHGTVHQSAVLGLGISGDRDGAAWIMENLSSLSPNERPHAFLALGLARHAPAIPMLIDNLPRSSRGRATTDENLAALHALGLYGPEFVDEMNADNRDGIEKIEDLADARGDAATVTQAVATLARLQVEQRSVEAAFRRTKTNDIQWTSLLSLAHYTDDPDVAEDAADALMKQGFKSGKGQSKNFTLLALGDLAGKLDPNSKTRTEILRFLKEEGLDTKINQMRSSAALALGLANDHTAVPAIADLLQDTTVDDQVIGAACVSLGLLRATEYADLIQREVLDKKSWKPDARGYGLLGLALMGDTTRMPDIRKVVAERPAKETERQMSLALGVLGEKDTAKKLVGYFSGEWKTNKRYLVSNAAYGLAWLRDQSVVDDVVDLAKNSPHASVRGMAVVALGYLGAADRVNPLTRIYENVSYRNDFAGWNLLVSISEIL